MSFEMVASVSVPLRRFPRQTSPRILASVFGAAPSGAGTAAASSGCADRC